MTDSRYVLIITTPSGRRFGIRLDPGRVEGMPGGPGVPVVEDVDAGTELGQAGGSCDPFLVDVDGERQIICAGTPDLPGQQFVTVNGQRARVCDGVWMTFPEPFTEGMTVEFAGLDKDQRELFRIQSAPLTCDRLMGLFGPSWTTYAPKQR